MLENIFNPEFTRLRVPYILMTWLWILLFGNFSFWRRNFHDSYFRFIFRPPLCLLVFLFASSIGIVFIHTYTLLQLKVQIYIAIGIAIGIFAALLWLFLAHRESKSIKRKLHAQYIIQQNMKNQVRWNSRYISIYFKIIKFLASRYSIVNEFSPTTSDSNSTRSTLAESCLKPPTER